MSILLRSRAARTAGLALLISVCIVLATATDRAERRHALRLDFSFNSITTQNERTEEILSALPHPVHAIALATPGREDAALVGLLERFAAATDKFTWESDNLVNNPLLAQTLSSSLEDAAVTADSLIIRSSTTGRVRVLDPYDFLAQEFDSDRQTYVLSGARYEAALAEALLFVTSDDVPKARLLTGQGELGPQETEALESLLKEAMFDVARVDLASGDTLEADALLVILSPQRDLGDGELQSILAFARGGGALLVASDYSDPDSLPNFDALYRSLGFERKPGIVIADVDDAAAYADNPLFLTPYVQMTEPTAPLIGAGQTLLRLPGARAFGIVETADALVSPLLLSGFSYIKPVLKAEATLAREGGEEEGQFNLALLIDKAHPNGNRTRAAALGNSALLTDSWLHEVTYAVPFLLALVDYLSPREVIALDIPPRTLIRPQLVIAAPWVPVMLIILLPTFAAAAGFLLLRHRGRNGHAAR